MMLVSYGLCSIRGEGRLFPLSEIGCSSLLEEPDQIRQMSGESP